LPAANRGRSCLRNRPARAGDHRLATSHHIRVADRQPSRGGRHHHPGLPVDPDPGTSSGGSSSWLPWWACSCSWGSSPRWASPTTPKQTTPTTAAVVAAPTSEVTFPPTTTMPPTTVPRRTARPTTTRPPTTAAPATHPPATKPPTTKPPAKNCDPAYPDACLHDGIGDYDCAGGSGNGPNYVRDPIRVRPPDPFGLDRDGDGVGCET